MSADADTEERALAAIESTFDTLSHWFERLGTPYIPESNSTLEADDLDWPFMPVSQVAWVGLAGAADHLDAIRHQIISRRLFSFAQLTLCRSALVGASQVVWVLVPDNPLIRVRRARAVAAYVYEHRLKYLYELRGLYPEPDEGIEFQISKDEERQEQLQVKRTTDGQTKRDKLFTGAMIKDASPAGRATAGSLRSHVRIWDVRTNAVKSVELAPRAPAAGSPKPK
jgi:hypothetical protein